MALTAEQKRKKRERKLAKAERTRDLPAARPKPERPVLGDFAACQLRGYAKGPGPANLTIVRSLSMGGVRLARFLIDPDCFGVKDAFWDNRSLSSARRALDLPLQEDESVWDLLPSEARAVLEEAVEFARGLGFEPGGDYLGAAALLADVEPAKGRPSLRFPSGDKPLFGARPQDSSRHIRHVLETLLDSVGSEGFHFILDPSQARGLEDLLERMAPDR